MSHKIEEFMKRHPFPKIVGVHPIWYTEKVSEESQKIEKEMNQFLSKGGKLRCYKCPVEMKERPHPTKPYVIEIYCPRCGFYFEVLTLKGEEDKIDRT